MDALQAYRLRGFGGFGQTTPLLGSGVDWIVVGTCGIVHALSWEGMLKPFPYMCVEPCVAVHMCLNMHVRSFTIIIMISTSMGCLEQKEQYEKHCHAEAVVISLRK